ncbi:MAG: transglycosylase domain-containing protein [Corynebacterium sp.]|nr:transglycosylase domain-containing protein [Corynebacterium sp.]
MSHALENKPAPEPKRQRTRTRRSATKGNGWKLALGIIVPILVLLLVVPTAVFAIAYSRTDIPTPDHLTTPQMTYIYARDGETQIARVVPQDGNRVQVSLDEIPQTMKDAIIAAEDREFYTNPGFSVSGYLRAGLGLLTGNESAGGGSTITQQYVKNALVGNERTINRKLRELVASAKMTREWSKDQILEAYLNTVYFGRNAYGVASAAKAYFDKDLGTLTAEEAAVLAAAVQRPSVLEPWVNWDEAFDRWNYVMDGMVVIGAMDQNARNNSEYPATIDPAENNSFTIAEGPNGLIKQRVYDELLALGFDENTINTAGLRITTTIDPVVQEGVVTAARNGLQYESENMRTAVVSIEPQTGAIRGYYGGEDSNGWDYANAPLQTGSTFKIFGLTAAVHQGIPLSKMYSSAPVQTGNATVNNADGETCGTCTIQTALKMSLNTSFIRMQKDLKNGADDTAAMAYQLGVSRDMDLQEDNGHSADGVILGMYPVRPLDMAQGLSTLTADGIYHKAHFVQRITDANGDELYTDAGLKGERRIEKNTANAVTASMLPIAAWSGGNVLNGGRQSANKTGTVEYPNEYGTKDAWMIGSTPQLATAVWVGTTDNSRLVNSYGGSVYGAGIPATIWRTAMNAALVNADYEQFNLPVNVGYNSVPETVGDGTETSNSSAPTTSATDDTGTGEATGAGDGTGAGAGGGGGAEPVDPNTIVIPDEVVQDIKEFLGVS